MVADLVTTGDTAVLPDWRRYRLERFATSVPSAPLA
jgi:hypothetical protein